MNDAAGSPNGARVPDFLQQIVDRAFDRASPLSPRLPSLFEPPAATFVWPAGADGEDAVRPRVEGTEDQPARDAVRPDRSSLASAATKDAGNLRQPDGDSVRVAPPTDAHGAEAAVAIAQAPRDRETDRAAATLATARDTPRIEAETTLPSQVAVDDATPGRQHHQLRLADEELPRGVLAAQRPIAFAQADGSSTVEPGRPRGDVLPRPVDGDVRPADPRHASEVPVRRIVLEPPTTSRRPHREPLRAGPTPPEPEPVVNVTIGRIEVRAVAAPPAPTRQRAQAQKPLSLDEYLKQRGSGR